MSGHISWSAYKQAKAPVSPQGTERAHQNLIAFTRGYILALEDTLRDLELVMGPDPVGPGAYRIRVEVQKHLKEAQRGLEVLFAQEP